MNKFNVGDKSCVCVHRVGGNWYKLGDQLTIRRFAGEVFDEGRRYNAYNTTDCDDNGVWIEEADFELVEESVSSALDKQISGNHYKGCKIQPVEYIQANDLDYLQGNVIKYVTRHKLKNGKADIEKAIHYLELILELQYGE